MDESYSLKCEFSHIQPALAEVSILIPDWVFFSIFFSDPTILKLRWNFSLPIGSMVLVYMLTLGVY